MNKMHQKAAVIDRFFATVLTGFLISGLIGGVGYAWNTNADFAVLQKDVKKLSDADFNTRMTTLEQQFKSIDSSLSRQELHLNKIDDKLHNLLDRAK